MGDLSQEMFNRLGIQVRHGVTGHSEARGAVERWSGNVKNLLHIVMNSGKPRERHHKLPCLLLAYRTVPHRTTNNNNNNNGFRVRFGVRRRHRGPIS